jgi:hypothetical protein
VLGTLRIDLDAAPDQRWAGLAAFAAEVRALVASYTRDLGGLERWAGPLVAYREAVLDQHMVLDAATGAVHLRIPA